MRAIKEARKYIERKPKDAQAKTLSRLVLALESEAPFPITELYQLDMDRFTLALQILEEWRLDRYYASKARLLDVSLRLADLSKPQKATKATKATKAKPGAATPSKPKAKPAAKPASKSTPKSTPKSAAKPASKANTKTTAKDAGKKKTERKKTAKR